PIAIAASNNSKNKVLKTDFISNVSHELKTPLAVIQNYATALKNCNEDKQTQKKYVETILQASKNLSALVTNVLSLNKLENQSVKLELQKFNLTEGLAQAVLNYEDAMEKKGIELNCNFDDVTIYSAPNYLEIIFNNLISNAVKFTSKGGKITVNLKRENDKAVVQVKDNGCGISVESGARIFEKFYQCDTSHSQKGNGLGLALVKKVIDVLGGEISVNSTLGEGSTFTVTLKGVINE
ncbi:MAG: HAMP domain-containing histidine kinase, partial [Clostridia bacterium]|nr:HAMP domain-containing histidine kinase [Clostridia bacterium]